MWLNIINKKTITTLVFLISINISAIAQDTNTIVQKTSSGDSSFNTLRFCLAVTVLMLIWVMVLLSNTAKAATNNYIANKKKKETANEDGNNLKKIVSTILLLFVSQALFAQEETTVATQSTLFKLKMPLDIYMFIVVILLEVIIIIYLQNTLNNLLGIRKIKQAIAEETKKVKSNKKSFFNKINQTVPLEEEHTLDLQHSYDGIRELDNKVPQWWQMAFYACILISIVYMYRFFVSETLPSQYTELAEENHQAEIKMQQFLKNAANNVDENSVTLTDANGISSGAGIYAKNCVACHGDKGQGNSVGPNLTDEYWLHKGGIKDIFKTIKYGWPEKGMKSWKQDLSPVQMAQVASYIVSLKGSNPAGAKEKQGELYVEESAQNEKAKDSTTIK